MALERVNAYRGANYELYASEATAIASVIFDGSQSTFEAVLTTSSPDYLPDLAAAILRAAELIKARKLNRRAKR